LAWDGWDGSAGLWDAQTRHPVDLGDDRFKGHAGPVRCLVYSPSGDTLASCGHDGRIYLWDGKTGKTTGAPIASHDSVVSSIVFDPDGETLISGSWDGTVRLWDPVTRQPIGEPLIPASPGLLLALALSPDGRTLASSIGLSPSYVMFWDLQTRRPRGAPLTAHAKSVAALAFSPDGTTLASGSLDATVRLWDVESGQATGQLLTAHTGGVVALAFSPDGRELATAGWDGKIRVWEMDPERWRAHACQIAGRNFTHEEWVKYMPGYEYEKACEQWPEAD
jgi:WD40 repeat protein